MFYVLIPDSGASPCYTPQTTVFWLAVAEEFHGN